MSFLNKPPQVCGVCCHRTELHMPDNRTIVPCCSTCWAAVPPEQRLAILVQVQQGATLDGLLSILNEWVEARAVEMATEKLSSRNMNDHN